MCHSVEHVRLLAAIRLNQWYFTLYVVWSKIIFIELIPYITILICNAFIITKITKESASLSFQHGACVSLFILVVFKNLFLEIACYLSIPE